MRELTHGGFFSGSGTWELVAKMAGIRTLWESEIEPYPVALEAVRFPEAKQLGDITNVNGRDLKPVDILSSSSPCTDVSIAGKREGMAEGSGTRSSLFHEVIRITKEMRDADAERQLRSGRTDVDIRLLRPRFWCWENVTGAFSSGKPKGEDFRNVLEQISKIVDPEAVVPLARKWTRVGLLDGNGYQIAWREMDASVWVPQRRKRIFLVADLGGHSAGEILFERKGVSWNFKEIAETWQNTSESLEDRIAAASEYLRERYGFTS